MSSKLGKVFFLFMGVLCIAGCSTSTKVTIDSSPQGAQVILDGKVIGDTPIYDYKISNRLGRVYSVVLQKEGHQTLHTKLKTETKAASVVGAVLLLVPVIWVEGPQENQYFLLPEEKSTE
ncbi:PEGA domain-containing protein [Breznakiella homolactica]|uniref:PEGA domain-containing protein n=1 Tax=Breznakiella homolactica TaxID=2798577 RepID=A0A7T8BA51_9SPIR|nr:PEGA domain-containing protein [Breznakiella homolactica]QQO09167.1 PEGA domain-containing protein [Breznakiella homolactica]